MSHLIPHRSDLFRPIEQHLDKMFDEFFSPQRLPSLLNSVKSRSGYPKLDMLETTSGEFKIECNVAGCNPDDIKVEIIPNDNGHRLLRISGKCNYDHQYDQDTDFYMKEITRSKFRRTIGLPDKVKDDPECTLQNGMLTLAWKVQTSQEPEAKVIPIK